MPNLVMLIGLPGSGKSTFAEKNYPSFVYLSSDKIREELYGDAAVQDNPERVFSLMRERAIQELENGNDVVYDATNLVRKFRVNFIKSIPTGHLITAHVIWAPLDECIKRDSERERTVGKEVIFKMAKKFDAPWYDEGFTSILYNIPYRESERLKYAGEIICAMKIPHDNPHHTADIYNHCINCEKYLEDKNVFFDIQWAGLFHDVGKPLCKTFFNGKGEISETAHYYDHQHLSAWMACGAAGSSSFSIWLISSHMEPYFNSKYYKNMSKYMKDALEILHEADKQAH